jgi:hydrogenase maturation protease
MQNAFCLVHSAYCLLYNMKILVLGLGNPLLSDDGVGWRVAEKAREQIANPDIEIDFHAGGGLSLMERLSGYDRAIIVDAINTGRKPQGTVDCFRLEDLPNYAQSHLASAHETTLQTALQVGRTMGAALPNDILIVAIEAQNVYDFSEELSPAVARAVPKAVELIISQISELSTVTLGN